MGWSYLAFIFDGERDRISDPYSSPLSCICRLTVAFIGVISGFRILLAIYHWAMEHLDLHFLYLCGWFSWKIQGATGLIWTSTVHLPRNNSHTSRDVRLERPEHNPSSLRQQLTSSPAQIKRCDTQVKVPTREADWHGMHDEGT